MIIRNDIIDNDFEQSMICADKAVWLRINGLFFISVVKYRRAFHSSIKLTGSTPFALISNATVTATCACNCMRERKEGIALKPRVRETGPSEAQHARDINAYFAICAYIRTRFRVGRISRLLLLLTYILLINILSGACAIITHFSRPRYERFI